jgi:NMD protein affecting ribosome stability and mRNA decay
MTMTNACPRCGSNADSLPNGRCPDCGHDRATVPPVVDLRHLAIILDQGSKTAEKWQDAALSRALGDMAEVAVQLHLDPDGSLFNVEQDFAALVERLT